MKLIACVLLISLAARLNAQQLNTEGKDDSLKLKTVLMMGPGVVCTLTGVPLTIAGTINLKRGVEWGGSLINPTSTDYRPGGRVMLSFGVPLLAGGIALIAAGAYIRTSYFNKKRNINLTTGYLEDGNVGAALHF